MTQSQKERVECFVTFYYKGEKYHPDMTYTTGSEGRTERLINTYYYKSFEYNKGLIGKVIRRFKTPYRIYDIEVVHRSPETETLFAELESNSAYDLRHEQIWKCHFEFDYNPHSDQELDIYEQIHPVGDFFVMPTDCKKDLQSLIAYHVWNGWKRTEVISAIHKLLKLEHKDTIGWRQEIEQLRQWVEQAPEVIAA